MFLCQASFECSVSPSRVGHSRMGRCSPRDDAVPVLARPRRVVDGQRRQPLDDRGRLLDGPLPLVVIEESDAQVNRAAAPCGPGWNRLARPTRPAPTGARPEAHPMDHKVVADGHRSCLFGGRFSVSMSRSHEGTPSCTSILRCPEDSQSSCPVLALVDPFQGSADPASIEWMSGQARGEVGSCS